MDRPTTFISYAYDSPEHREWVRELADNLISQYGIPVILDEYELEAGHELTYFMESSLERADKVLLILTPGYKGKAGNRQGGAGFEYSMISREMMATQTGKDKFIPVLRAGTFEEAAPLYLQGRVYHDMRPDKPYGPHLLQLARLLYNEPEKKKPALGPVPDFSSPAIDPNLRELQQLSAAKTEADRLAGIVNSYAGIGQAEAAAHELFQLLREKATLYQQAGAAFHFHFEGDGYRRCRVVAGRHTVMVYWSKAYANTAHDSALRVLYWAGIANFEQFSMPMHSPPTVLRDTDYAFDLGLGEQPQWRAAAGPPVTNADLVQEMYSFLIDKLKAAR